MNPSRLKLAGAVLLASVLALAAKAVPISYSAAVDGVNVPNATVSATGGALTAATKNGVTFLGVAGGFGGTEIDVSQTIDIVFDSAVQFDSITFGLLFDGPEYGDIGEIAASIVNAGSTYELKIVGLNSAEWYKDGVFQFNVAGGPTVLAGAGLFTVANPFGATLVSTLTLTPTSVSPGPGESNSDFGLVAFNGQAVPDGGTTALMLGAVLLGFGATTLRRRKAAKV